jgi:hypothetical protein
MNAVIDMMERQEAKRQQVVSEVICIKCMKRWIGVWPKTTLLKELECEICGQGYVIQTGENNE